jgi:hypothetical protein
MNVQRNAAVGEVLSALVETVREAGSMGAPGGLMYAALMGHGCSLEQFETLMSVLVRLGKVSKRGDCYFPVAA